jgi:N-formylglutamate amidohydrolase
MSRFAVGVAGVVGALCSAFAVCAPVAPESPKPEEFVFVQKGTLPIIISVPHGGRKKVPDVPERVGKGLTNFQTVRDENTAELAEKLITELEDLLKGKPWVVMARFERKYLDVNRSREEGYESDTAKPYYDAYHGALETACKTVRDKHKHGILLDIHGQGIHINAICRGTQNLKTVKMLKDREGMAAIRGKNSVLGRMERLGYKIMPASNDEDTAKEEPKFTGGYIVGTYGSHTPYAIDAIQVELGSSFRDKAKYATTAKDLADAIRVFYDAYLKDIK